MPVNYKAFQSKFGFESPGFSVDDQGNVILSSLAIDAGDGESILSVDNIIIKGVQLVEGGESTTISLGDEITGSNLRSVGTLDFLNIDGDLTISEGSTPYFSVVDGVVNISSSSNIGKIDNIEIGLAVPRAASFTSLNVGPGDSAGELSVQGEIIGSGNLSITGNADIGSRLASDTLETNTITSDDITINNQPTEISDATRKDYVDTRISAFSIAFGA